MPTVQIIPDIDKEKALFRKYFKFEKNRKLWSSIYLWMIAAGLLLSFVAFTIDSNILLYLGAAISLICGIILVIWLIQFQQVEQNYMKKLAEEAIKNEEGWTFEFNDEKIIYQMDNARSEMQWDAIHHYTLNDGDLYLFRNKEDLLDIISQDILGEEAFMLFSALAIQKLRKL